ncbi:sialidase family protein [Micromonospora deserti]|uniref:Exo-alpha-sialidase n=1 Tax=Micromonospora deserti TaxID=2070366 RepID=A0A2W2BWM2_9ACTN|nr:sialidase family protein [Micromonospora deserti]PZF91695.1 hypothetical protein C1I99_22995 [Micromonospora deserti]
MTGLREMFDEVAEGPAPPSHLVADDVYSAGRRRRTRNGLVKGALAAVALVVAVGLGGVIVTRPGGEPPAPGGSPDSAPDVSGPAQWVGAADATHLYATYMNCPGGPCAKALVRLVASDDGGRTWQERGTATEIIDLVVVDRQTLVAVKPEAAIAVSVDGGRTWSAATQASRPITEVPDGGTVLCTTIEETTGRCLLYVVDPKSRMFAPLATPPDSLLLSERVESAAGHLWVAGTTEGKPCLPAASVSTDGGRNWTIRVLADPPGRDEGCDLVRITTTADGKTAYVVVGDSDDGSRSIYRVPADGKAELVATTDTKYSRNDSFVAADGTHVLAQMVRGERLDEVRWWALTGSGYQPIALDGLPATVYPVRRAADGWFYTFTYGSEQSIYGSIDGRHWSAVPVPGR